MSSHNVQAPEQKSLTEAAGMSGCAGVEAHSESAEVGTAGWRNLSVGELPRDAVTFENGEYTIDAAVLAPRRGLKPDRLKVEMRRALVVSTF